MTNKITARKQLFLIVKNEYLTDIRTKGFWITTLLVPILMGAFSIFMGFLAKDSDAMQAISNPTGSNMDDYSMEQVIAMLVGMFLTLFIMMYGAQIFNKIKTEKTNRIVEILSTCVQGKIMMMAKIISVALIGLTQVLIWALMLTFIISGIFMILMPGIDFSFLKSGLFWTTALLSILFFVGGYLLYGSLYAAVGAMTDRNNENQEYMTILTFILLASFYVGQFAVDNSTSALTIWCEYIPFTSPTVGAINAISGATSWWQTLLSLCVLYVSAYFGVVLGGKIYRSSLLLTGKKFSPKDIVTFLRSK